MAGRKKLGAEHLARRIGFRITEAEHQTYLQKVAASGLTASEFFRDCVITNRTEIQARVPASADRKRVLYVVSQAGNNLNQLAHAANTAQLTNRLSDSLFVDLLDRLEAIQQLLKAHLKHVD